MKIDVSNDILTLFNRITLDIRDYLFDKSQKTEEKFICENGTYKTVTFVLSEKRVSVEIHMDHGCSDFIKVYIGNNSDQMTLISTVKDKFIVNCIPNLSTSCSGQNYFQYQWDDTDIEKFIDIARTHFHTYEVKRKADQKRHNFRLSVITKAIDPYIDNLSDKDIKYLAQQLRSTLDWVKPKEDNKMIDDSYVRYFENKVKELKEKIEEIEQRHYEELDPVKQELEDTEWELASARVIFDSQKNEDVVDDE